MMQKQRDLHPSEDIGLLAHHGRASESHTFDPYAGFPDAPQRSTPRGAEEGYGGGRWTYDDIRRDEKSADHHSESEEEDITAEPRILSPQAQPPSYDHSSSRGSYAPNQKHIVSVT
jgi:hypothetical protein